MSRGCNSGRATGGGCHHSSEADVILLSPPLYFQPYQRPLIEWKKATFHNHSDWENICVREYCLGRVDKFK